MISLIICTYNRSESLRKTLQSLKEMSVPVNLSWEVIVVDNNSSDNTRKVVEDFVRSSELNIRYVFEGKQGHSHARNTGVKEAKGEIIAFTDDDVIVEKSWIHNIDRIFKEDYVGCIGGKILPIWEKPCPKWLTKDLYGYLALLDYGENPFYIDSPEIWGANFAVKSSLFQKYGYFDTTLGRLPTKLYADEETEFFQSLLKGGEKILYSPDILVYHCIPAHRIKKSYFRKWRYDEGELRGIRMGYYGYRNILGIPLYSIKQLIQELFKYLWIQIFYPQNAFIEQLRFIYIIGFFAGRIRFYIGSK